MAVKVITLNVNGMAERPKRTMIFDFLRQYKADLYLLQETHNAGIQDEQNWTREWGGPAVWSSGSHHSRGVALLVNPKSNCNINRTLNDIDGRVIAAQIEVMGTELNIINVYAPTVGHERKVFYDNIWSYKTGDHNLIIAGDFNCVEDIDKDKLGGNPSSGTTGVNELQQFLTAHELVDAWRKTHSNDRIYTWSTKDFTIRSRLDRLYIPQNLLGTTFASIRACPLSDHSVAEISIQPNGARARGKGVWKMNNGILEDKTYQREVRGFIEYWKYRKKEFQSIGEWWDEGKRRIKVITIRSLVRKSRNRRKQEDDLKKKLTQLKNEGRPKPDKIIEIEHQLNDIIQKRLEGVKIRSRASWIEEGEKPTKFFFDLERKKQSNAIIYKLEIDGQTVNEDTEIMETIREFYQQLYTKEAVDRNSQRKLISNLDRKISSQMRITCEGPVTKDELEHALKKMNLNKSPGPDGITTEFYQTFWDSLAEDIVEVFNSNFMRGSMTESQRESLLRLLYKKDNRALLTNWRPISLLNTDYKILATVMALRLRPTLPSIIDEDQTCGIPERTIFDNILRVRDLAKMASDRSTNLILIGLDQEKAFDRVDRQFLLKILEHLNFGPSFCNWITTLYAGARCKVINNGRLSEYIHLERGVRQGCPLSPLLYTIVLKHWPRQSGKTVESKVSLSQAHHAGVLFQHMQMMEP